MNILDCCISLKMIKTFLVVLGVVDMRQLLLNLIYFNGINLAKGANRKVYTVGMLRFCEYIHENTCVCWKLCPLIFHVSKDSIQGPL